MRRNLHEITPATTSYEMGLKRVLLSANESGCSITQIAVIDLKAGEKSAMHIHPDLQDVFYILDGTLEVTIDGQTNLCHKDDFIFIEHLQTYQLHAITDVQMLAMGCVIESQRTKLYPMLFEPNLHTKIWGGEQLATWKNLPHQQHIGESWEVSAVPSAPSIIANGTWAGYPLTEVVSKMPDAILGKAVAKQYQHQLPVLVKFIDANDDLSIQVHPDNAMAQREHNKMGKNEMWYILTAEPGACIYAGFQEQLTEQEYQTRIADGSIIDALAKHQVKAGDVFYIPAGRVHAIGKGIRLLEVQQSSEVTYRIYDFNRVDSNGATRELHTEESKAVIDYSVLPDYRTHYEAVNDQRVELVSCPYFTTSLYNLTQAHEINLSNLDSFVIIICTEGKGTITDNCGNTIPLQQGETLLVPATVEHLNIVPEQPMKLLTSWIDAE